MPKQDDPKIHTGELLRVKKGSLPDSPKRQSFLESLFDSRRWLWMSRLWTKQADALRGLVEAETKLGEAYKERWRKIEDLKDIDTTLDTDRETRKAGEFEARMRRVAAERAYRERFQDKTISTKRKDHEIRRLDDEEETAKQKAEIRRLENEKRLRALKADLEPKESEQPKKKRAASTTELFREKERIDKEVAKREAVIDASKASKEKKASDKKILERWREEQCERIEKQFGRGVDNDEA
ncbi:MAG: hypothetical protein ACREUI_03215 [Burkholderiales bacterium]